MIYLRFLGVCLMVMVAFPAYAAVQPIIDLPSTYVSGTPVTFSVQLPEMDDLGAYQIDIVLESSSGVAGVDYFFDVTTSGPSPLNYVFPVADNFFAAATTESSLRHRISLTDFDFGGVDVVAGINDRAAVVTLNTQLSFHGTLKLYVDAATLIFDTPAAVPTPVAGFDVIQSEIAAAGALEVSQLPEPSSFVVMLGAIALLGGYGAYRRRLACRFGG